MNLPLKTGAEGRAIVRHVGPIQLAPGVTPSQVAVFLAVLVCLSVMLSFIGVLQPYLLDALGVAPEFQGRLTGNLSFVDQLAFLVFIGGAGTLADRIGRRYTLMLALTGMMVLNSLFPLASGIGFLFMLRFAFGISRTPHTTGGTAMMMDYPAERSRGKFLGLILVVTGLWGALLIGVIGVRLPGWLIAAGFTPVAAMRRAFWLVALAGIIGLAFAVFGLAHDAARPRVATLRATRRGPLAAQAESIRALYLHGRASLRFRFIMLMALVIRSDFAVMDAFLSLFVLREGLAVGLTRTQTLTSAGLCFAILRASSLAAPPVFGVLADRYNRSRLLAWVLALTAGAFLSILWVADVRHWTAYLDVALIGFCESGSTIVAQSILGEETPPQHRGISMAAFAFLGTIGALLSSTIGGQLFDRVGHRAPFVLIGLMNLAFAVGAAKLVRDQAALPAEASA